jgi:hypothetical protein
MAVGDLDGDLDRDLAVANLTGDGVTVLLNNGDGTFATGFTYPTGEFSWSVAMSDLDGDLDQDLAVTNASSSNVSVLMNQCPLPKCVEDLNGDGTVGINDFLWLLSDWGACGDCDNCPADLDDDCVVGITDFLQLLANWGEC